MSGAEDQAIPGDALVPVFTHDGHADEATLHAWIDGAFGDADAGRVQEHADACAVCQQGVAEARGLIAGASRIARLLDAAPGKVVAPADVKRTAARIIAAANLPPTTSRRAWRWAAAPAMRLAAIVLVSVGGALMWQRNRSSSLAEFAAPITRDQGMANSESDAALKSSLGDSGIDNVTMNAASTRQPADAIASADAQGGAERREAVPLTAPPPVVQAEASATSGVSAPPKAFADATPPAAERARISDFSASVVAGGVARGVGGGVADTVSANVGNSAATGVVRGVDSRARAAQAKAAPSAGQMLARRSVVAEAVVADTWRAPLEAGQCLAFRGADAATTNVAPRMVRVAVPPLGDTMRVMWTVWQETTGAADSIIVPMARDADLRYSGTLDRNGRLLQLAVTIRDGEWNGTMTVVEGERRTVFPVRYVRVNAAMCKF